MTQSLSENTQAIGYARPPSRIDRLIDMATRSAATFLAVGVVLLLAYIVYMIDWSAVPAIRADGFHDVTHTTWDVNTDPAQYGLLAAILGTLYSSCIALSIATVFGVAIAIFLSQNFLPKWLEIIFKNIVELLAAIPSVVYGLWGIFVVIPVLRDGMNLGLGPLTDWFENAPAHSTWGWYLTIHIGSITAFLNHYLYWDRVPWFTLFKGNLAGPGLFPAAIVLAIMVLPTISAISYDALSAVHPRLKEGAMGLGATKWETILKVIVPTASRGIFGAVILGFGRALGETMALAMLLGNVNQFHVSLFAPGNTLAALIANNFPEAQGDPDQVNALLFAGLVLLIIALIVNVIGAGIIQFANRGRKGALQ